MIKLNAFLLCVSITLVISSKCPESKMPHSSSCTMFYTCIDLPDGGYVWAPSKCTDGLVFQPYLRMCVLPGDTWTCNTSPAEFYISNKSEQTELTDVQQNTQENAEESIDASENIDSFHTVNDMATTLDKHFVTDYPLIENDGSTSEIKDEEIKELPIINPKQEFAEKFSNDRQQSLIKISDNENDKLSNHPSSNLNNTSKTNDGDKSNNFIETMEKEPVALFNILHVLNNNLEVVNNLIMITDNFGGKQYFTLEGYKPILEPSPSQTVDVIPCTRNIRLPNMTDCTMYYRCDPITANVVDYTCPFKTAFNKYTRLCDTQSYALCFKQKMKEYIVTEKVPINQNEDTVTTEYDKEPCKAIGKTEDPKSNTHYYVCYSFANVPAKIISVRLACPNNLIFCRDKKVCTLRRSCKSTQS